MAPNLLFTLLLFLSMNTCFSQEAVVKYGNEYNLNKVLFDTSGNHLFTQCLGKAYFWNGDAERPVEVDFPGSSGEVFLDGVSNRFIGLSHQFYDQETKTMYNTLLSYYKPDGSVEKIWKYPTLNIQRLDLHPSQPKLVFIGMDKNFEFICGLKNADDQETHEVLFQGKGALIPLLAKYDRDGEKIAIAYGNSANYGGIKIYDVATKKVIKDIPLKDQAKSLIWRKNGELVVHGAEKGTIIYDSSNWQVIRRYDPVFAGISQDGNSAVQLTMKGEAFLYDLRSDQFEKINHPALNAQVINQEFSLYFGFTSFSCDNKKICISLSKSKLRSNQIIQLTDEEKTRLAQKPSLLIVPVGM